jgi:hypothetical protein
MWMQQKKHFEKKKSKWLAQKKLSFSTLPILNIFSRKFQGLVGY